MRWNQGVCLLVASAALVLAACSSQKAPAHKMLDQIQSAIKTAGPDAEKYTPDDLIEVQKKFGELKAQYEKGDYKAVVNGAPELLGTAQSLATSAAVKKDQQAKALNGQWAALAADVPGNVNLIQSRIDFLSRPQNKKLASGVDIDSAQVGLRDAKDLWGQAQRSYAGGQVDAALASGNSAKAKLAGLAASMKIDLTQPAAVQDTTLGQ